MGSILNVIALRSQPRDRESAFLDVLGGNPIEYDIIIFPHLNVLEEGEAMAPRAPGGG